MTTYSYILAPHTENNYLILQEACNQYSDIAQDKRVKFVFKKSDADLLGNDNLLLVPADASQYIYLKATTNEIDYELLEGVTNYEIYTIDTQPFNTYWL